MAHAKIEVITTVSDAAAYTDPVHYRNWGGIEVEVTEWIERTIVVPTAGIMLYADAYTSDTPYIIVQNLDDTNYVEVSYYSELLAASNVEQLVPAGAMMIIPYWSVREGDPSFILKADTEAVTTRIIRFG